ncbi:acyltransferase family protein [Flavihumibacter profundi]|jgi:predicted acyltransferase|uniref:acyltransferase family protein n=1 Tax=Flavihumibacter profundi TaxID=2716883 RepID=UPI001CC7E96C|nr:heparan-alpha-glucosaminide N-acetyltransferase domain-containing protein [Flavihumibacter profundi]MBZ5858829.1 heparan-alpha-glucosaminide N-acetyltransferase domain-containing protein [Flavihumibacter profundi]
MQTIGKRLISLDAFRGYTVAAMIMVNFPGSEDAVFFTLRHTTWNGLSFTDQVAPYFLFIVGMSIAFAYTGKLATGMSKPPLYKKIIFRSLKIFAVGMFLNAMPQFDLHNLRWTGTLHRIAIVFLVSAIIFLNTNWKQQAWIALLILAGYWIVMTTIPTPGEGMVILEPGRNLAAWVDSKYLPGKMWQGTWDPEGIMSTFPSIATCILGMLAGRLMLAPISNNLKLNYLMTAGVISAITGYFLGLAFPVNENLWTSSFVLVTAGFAALVFGAFYFVSDILGYNDWCIPGVIFGANAITVYFMGDLLSLFFYQLPISGKTPNEHAMDWMVTIGLAPNLASWLYALFYVCINFIPAYILYKKKIFIKL